MIGYLDPNQNKVHYASPANAEFSACGLPVGDDWTQAHVELAQGDTDPRCQTCLRMRGELPSWTEVPAI